jgi:hypothetical protein
MCSFCITRGNILVFSRGACENVGRAKNSSRKITMCNGPVCLHYPPNKNGFANYTPIFLIKKTIPPLFQMLSSPFVFFT